ncbi:MAG: hypothetical protein ACLPPF_19220 [Rhodomicrobium sp.]
MIKHGLTAALLLVAGGAQAEDKEPSLGFEMAGVGSWGLPHGGSSFGPEVALEYTVMEDWLEIEGGFSPQFSKGQVEFDTGIVFKKPFELSKSFEFIIGAGPTWVHKLDTDSVAGEAIVEFKYFPWPERHIAVFVEPGYSYDFGRGHEQSLGVTLGLYVGIE